MRDLRTGTVRTHRKSISISAPLQTVWDLITTIDTIPEWYDSWDGVEHDATDIRLQVGTPFQLTRRRDDGCDETAHCRVTGVSVPTCLEWRQSAPDRPTVTVQFLLTPNGDGSTTGLHHTRTWTDR